MHGGVLYSAGREYIAAAVRINSMGSFVLFDLVGGIALLLWGLHMVQSGILRAFGADLRRVLGARCAIGSQPSSPASAPLLYCKAAPRPR